MISQCGPCSRVAAAPGRIIGIASVPSINKTARFAFSMDFPLAVLVPARSISQRFSLLEHMLDAFLSLLFAAETHKCFAFEVQQVLLRDALRGGELTAARKHLGQFYADHDIKIRDIFRAPHQVQPEFQLAVSCLPQNQNIFPWLAWAVAQL